MTPEEVQPAPAPVEPSAPAPPSPPAAETPSAPAPAPAPAPEREPEASRVDTDMWRAMLGQMGGPTVGAEPDAPPKPEGLPTTGRRGPSHPAPAVTPVPAPRQWAGRYQSPDELESAYTELEQARARAESEKQRAIEHAERLDRLIQATMAQRPPAPPQPPAGVDPNQWARQQALQAQPVPMQEALAAIQAEAERLALGDPQADPLRLVKAIAVASRLDDESRRYYGDVAMHEYQQRQEVQSALTGIQKMFFDRYPDLRTARPSLLRQIAIETEDALRQSRGDYGSPAYMQSWFDETAKQARASIRLGDGGVPSPGGESAARPQPTPAPARSARGAPFAETPAPRPQEPALSGQELHLARVFGRGV
jgi:hypothetical protein